MEKNAKIVSSLGLAAFVAAAGIATSAVRADEASNAMERALVADAQVRLGGQAGTPGWNAKDGFNIKSEDGNSMMKISGQLITRYTASSRQDQAVDQNDFTQGFSMPKTRVRFGGNVVSKDLKYNVELDFPANGEGRLLEGWAEQKYNDNLSIRLGQFKTPFNFEQSTSSSKAQFVENSLIDNKFNAGYSQGITAFYNRETYKLAASFNDGLRTLNSDWASTGSPSDVTADYSVALRGDVKFFGDWKDQSEFVGFRDGGKLWVLGAGVWQQDGIDDTSNADRTITRWTVDTIWKTGGGNIFAAFFGNHERRSSGELDQYGAVIQGGVFVTDSVELIARYEWGDLDGAGTVSDTASIATIGFNKYFAKHTVKVTGDVGYSFDPVDSGWASTGRGWLADAADEDGQIVFRLQMQVLF